jgi:uncharacterized protein (TIGR00290 family)
MPRPPALLSWSSGKDSAWALHEVRTRGHLEIVGLLTTVTTPYHRVAMHGVRESLLEQQAARVDLPLHRVQLPADCSNDEYQSRMDEALALYRRDGVSHIVFGDLFLRDIRDYREAHMARAGLTPVFPLWQRDTATLARTMLEAGLRALVTVIDPGLLDASLVGRSWDRNWLNALPPTVDPCGERGEFHTVVTDGPMFSAAIDVSVGQTVERNGFVFADIVPATDARSATGA